MSKLPPGVTLKLKKIGNAETFQLKEEKILPNGIFVLTPDFIEESAGSLSIDLIVKPEQISTNSAVYQEVAKWVVLSKKAYLDAIAIDSDTPGIAQYRVTIISEIFADKKVQNILNLDIPDQPKPYDLKKGDTVLIEVKSDGATTIVVDGLIQGREVK